MRRASLIKEVELHVTHCRARYSLLSSLDDLPLEHISRKQLAARGVNLGFGGKLLVLRRARIPNIMVRFGGYPAGARCCYQETA
jgi:hypothetical protein